MNGGEQIKLFDKFDDIFYDKDGKKVKIIYPSVFIKEHELYYDSEKQVSDILYLFCMRGDLTHSIRYDKNFRVELRLNPIICDLFQILLYLKNENGLLSEKLSEYSGELTPELFIENINKQLAKKLKLYERYKFGNQEFEKKMKNVNLSNSEIREMEKLENSRINMFFVKSTGLGKALELLELMYILNSPKLDEEQYNINRIGIFSKFGDLSRFGNINRFGGEDNDIDKLKQMEKEKQKIDYLKLFFMLEEKKKGSLVLSLAKKQEPKNEKKLNVRGIILTKGSFSPEFTSSMLSQYISNNKQKKELNNFKDVFKTNNTFKKKNLKRTKPNNNKNHSRNYNTNSNTYRKEKKRKLDNQKPNPPKTVSTVLLNRQIQRRNSNLPPELNLTN